MISADLGSQLERFVVQLVESGRYASKSEVLREGVRLIQDREVQLDALDAVVLQSVVQSGAGQGTDAAIVFDRLEAKYCAMSAGKP